MPWPALPFPAAPSLRIEFSEGDNNVFFLYPSLEFEDKVPIADTTVEGKVILTLPAPRKVSVVTVELIGHQQFPFRQKTRTVETLRKLITVNIDNEEGQQDKLPAGEHTFAFSINIPSNVAPSLCNFGVTGYNVIAHIPQLGRLGGSLVCSRGIGLFVNHSGKHNGFPPPHSWTAEWFHDRLGPIQIETTSKHFMVGGYLRWSITWVEYLLPFKIIDLTVEIVETFTITPSPNITEPYEKYRQRHSLYRLREDTAWPASLDKIIRPGDPPASISRQMRIPYDQKPRIDKAPHLSPTHHPASQSCVMPSTQIVLTLIFEQYEGGVNPTQGQLSKPSLQEMQLSANATLSSCFMRREYMELPAYQAEGKDAMSNQASSLKIPKGVWGFSQCMCKEMSREEEQNYGISQEEMQEHSEAEQAARTWLETNRATKEDTTG